MNDFHYSLSLPYFNTYEYGHTPSASSSSYFNIHNYAQEDILSYLNIHNYNDSANTSLSFYSNAYEQDFINTLQSPDPISSFRLSTNNELVESDVDVDTRPCKVDNAVYVDEKKNRRNRDSERIGCPWHINLAFSKTTENIQVNSIVGSHNHEMNHLVSEIALRYQKLTYEMLDKIKFWTIQEKMGLITQYNLLVASFLRKIINKKDQSNAIQRFKSQIKPNKNDAYKMLDNLYSKKEENLMWINTQRAEVTNKIIKNRLNRTSWLMDIVEKIQAIFNQQSKKAALTECKNEIPTKGIPTILDEYFPELDKILKEYLTPQILQNNRIKWPN
ncbi:15457_t:CDS:2 [Cetraspora pellucida]|uniref:15457_t:CDS:1 n=1 Tax=Cetraspora pellucida TaxID=1433469 RepID=A0A9N9I2V5_9GLOM|nr:15457_t:CDS:2 [Cetraspora pellucida]